jgi:hypothetical protein
VEVENLQFAPRSDGPVGLGGWLILPMIGLFLTVLVVGYSAVTQVAPMLIDSTWSNLTTPGNAGYHASWAPYMILSALSHLVMFFGSIALLALMFLKKRILPALMMGFYVFAVLFALVDFWAVFTFLSEVAPTEAGEMKPAVIKDLARAVFACLTWIPYFATSKRVKNTFVS